MDLVGLEMIDLNVLGGADTIKIDDQIATDLSAVNLDLEGLWGQRRRPGTTRSFSMAPRVPTTSRSSPRAADRDHRRGPVSHGDIIGVEATNDTRQSTPLGCDDVIDASLLPANLIG